MPGSIPATPDHWAEGLACHSALARHLPLRRDLETPHASSSGSDRFPLGRFELQQGYATPQVPHDRLGSRSNPLGMHRWDENTNIRYFCCVAAIAPGDPRMLMPTDFA